MEQDQQQLRNLRDFLLVYNRMTEICFQRCTSNLNYRNLTMDEERCVDSCAGKLIRSNHRLMGTYVQLMPGIVQRRLEEMEAKSSEMAAAAETSPTATVALPEGAAAPSPPCQTWPPRPQSRHLGSSLYRRRAIRQVRRAAANHRVSTQGRPVRIVNLDHRVSFLRENIAKRLFSNRQFCRGCDERATAPSVFLELSCPLHPSSLAGGGYRSTPKPDRSLVSPLPPVTHTQCSQGKEEE
ncbi:hypothetical protein SKAU_G00323040 [Synaphobranchus kaupii]|uniref:Mitochondrial import inner membrane translocase subunit Tim10 B n=1 Tax=Synaphobranchus kaupii TaxID=118154 RepID=A0A9Q1IJZ3_SYNKA|nr:hypothetical protein SKAU_G00323040 [Synaphobranchus kaupii]